MPGRLERVRGQVSDMTVTTDRTPTTDGPGARQPVRLSLQPTGTRPLTGPLDGAWWPRSRDLLLELPGLIDALDPLRGRISRVTVNPSHWPVVPKKVPVSGRVVKTGWFTAEQDPHKLLLMIRYAGRWDLLVIPPETGPTAAARLMTAASDPHLLLTASALIAAEVTGETAEETGETAEETGETAEETESEREQSPTNAEEPRAEEPRGEVFSFPAGVRLSAGAASVQPASGK